MSLKRQQQSSVDAALSPTLARHVLPIFEPALQNDNPDQNSIEVGSIYEIDHAQLPTRTPVQLRSIRIVIVSEKADRNITVKYPSLDSLNKHFSNRMSETFPSLEEKFTMGTKLAGKVLYREVSSQEFAENMNIKRFWLVNSVTNDGLGDVLISKKDTSLTSVLKCSGMLKWGVRRQVKFLGKHREIIKSNNNNSSSSFITGGGKVKWVMDQKQESDDEEVEVEERAEEEEEEEKKVEEEAEEEEEEEQDDEEDNDNEDDDDEETNKNLKRKRYSFRNNQKTKKKKCENQRRTYNIKSKNKCKQIVLKNPINRWSAERYKSAEKNLLEVMKAKGAVFGKPILRPALRAEARKRIGDTGLLDHLLKHMAGKVAPGGNDRFRRRHNADGAMEYWLESADLVSIRKEAGVDDPYWTPPPGWKLGDCPTQDPMCAKELNLLKAENSKIRRDMEEMVSKQQFEEEVARLRREVDELVSMKDKQKESQAIVVPDPDPIDICDKMDPIAICDKMDLDDHANNSLVSSDFNINTSQAALVNELDKYKKKLLDITDLMRGMEEEIGKLKSKVEAGEKAEEKMMIKQQKEEKRKPVSVSEPPQATPPPPPPVAVAEQKAEKIKRLKSGFRICKPQGTFLWPNMAAAAGAGGGTTTTTTTTNNNHQVVVQFEDLFMVPTPPSVSSSSAHPLAHHYQYHHRPPPSPVRPVPERRAVTVTVSTVSNHGGENNYSNNNGGGSLINLNDAPASEVVEGGGAVNSTSSSASCLSNNGVETWLALATPNPAGAGAAPAPAASSSAKYRRRG